MKKNLELSAESCENLLGDLSYESVALVCESVIATGTLAAVILALTVGSAVVGAALASGMLAGKVELLAELHKSLKLVAGDLLDVSVLAYADLTSVKVDLCVELYLFHSEASSLKGVTNGKSTVVLQKECVVLLDVGHKGLGNLHGGGHTVVTGRNVTDGKNCLGEDVLIELYACNGESGCNGGMSVNDSVSIGTLLINSHVHLDLGGGIELTLYLVTLTVDLDDHIGGHEALGYARRSAVVLVGSYFYGDVSVIGSYEAVVVDSLTNVADFFFDFKG